VGCCGSLVGMADIGGLWYRAGGRRVASDCNDSNG
jgi:hypothetical protein